MSTERRAYLHVGLQKTGTSFLQSHLWDSPRELAEQGVRMVPDNRTRAFHLARALTARDPSTLGTGPARVLDVVRRQVETAEEPVLLVSQESLAAADADNAATLKALFPRHEVHVVVTARDIARQLPSAWQQRVKSRGRGTLPQFVRHVREPGPSNRGFWGQQDLVAILDRWAGDLPSEQVHVVTAPPSGSPPELLAQRFGAVVGVDFGRLHADDLRANVSLDPAQAEMLRRLNVRGPVFEDRKTHARMVKQVLAGQVLAPRRSGSLRTPPEAAAWCREVAETQVAAVRERGWSVSGDLDDLMPLDSSFGSGEEIADGQVLDVALDAVAELLRRLERAQSTASRTVVEASARRPGEKALRRFRRRRG